MRELTPEGAVRVLHVVESFGGGVENAVQDYVRNTPELSHYLLFAERPEASSGPNLAPFRKAITLPRGHLNRVHAVRRAVHAVKPEVVHAHSSFAGAYTRLGIRSKPSTRVVYTPHCYAFERLDVRPAFRAVFRATEHALSMNTAVFAACSPREAALSGWRASRARVLEVPNVSPVPVTVSRRAEKGSNRVLAGAGRGGAQKDPDYFVQSVRAIKAIDPHLKAVWIGGDEKLATAMAADGIEVTGWLPRDKALQRMSEADLYLHTARWEGFPLAVLEAAAVGVPVVVRHIPSFQDAGLPLVIAEPSEVVRIWDRMSDPSVRRETLFELRFALRRNTDHHQRAALLAAYGLD